MQVGHVAVLERGRGSAVSDFTCPHAEFECDSGVYYEAKAKSNFVFANVHFDF